MSKPSEIKAPAGESKTPDTKGLDRRRFFQTAAGMAASSFASVEP
jgi:hypothetical protein